MTSPEVMLQNLTKQIVVDIPASNVTYLTAESGYEDIMNTAFLVNKYYLWIILAVGFPGNLATIITIFRMHSLGSFTLYVVMLAIMDNLAIMTKVLFYQLLMNKVNIGKGGCKSFSFLGNFLATFANWILVMMAVERLLAVRYPLKIQKFIGCKKSAIAICTVGFVIACCYSPILWISYYNSTYKSCDLKTEAPELRSILHWMNISLFAFIPFLILAMCNMLIIHVIRQSFEVRSALRNVTSLTFQRKPSGGGDTSVQRQIMLMLFTATLVFVVFLFPICAFNVADFHWPVTPLSRKYAIKYLCSQIAYVLCDSTHAVNFYLYFLSAKKFRNHFIQMSSCKTNARKASFSRTNTYMLTEISRRRTHEYIYTTATATEALLTPN